MHKNTLAYVIVAAVGGFILGFWFANSVNKSVVGSIVPANQPPNPSATEPLAPASNKSEPDLSDAEIKAKIDEADKNATNFNFQKDLGIALYRYSAMKQLPDLLPEAARILGRANSLNGSDYDVIVTLGNARFDIGFAKKDNAEFQAARDIYQKALKLQPSDRDVQTDLSLTYFYQQPPDYNKAQAELQKVVDADPQHDRSLQYLVRTLIKLNKTADAEKALAKLKTVAPQTQAIGELTAMLNEAKNGSEK